MSKRASEAQDAASPALEIVTDEAGPGLRVRVEGSGKALEVVTGSSTLWSVGASGVVTLTRAIRDDLGSGSWGDTSSFISLRRNMANLTGSQNSPVNIQIRARGAATVADRVNGIYIYAADSTAVATTPKAVTNAIDNGSGSIRLTVAAHGFATNDRIDVYGVGGVPNANTSAVITVIDANTFDLNGVAFSGAYTSGGIATDRSMIYGVTVVADLRQPRGGETGSAQNGDDVAAFVGINGSAAQNTAVTTFYQGRNSIVFTSIPEWESAYDAAGFNQFWAYGGAGRLAAGGAMFDASRTTFDPTSYAMQVQTGIWIRGIDQNQTNPTNMIRINPSFQVELGASTVLPVAGFLKTGHSVTGSRPSAATVGKGAQFYDDTLSKPVWSDGTNWKDAAGNTV